MNFLHFLWNNHSCQDLSNVAALPKPQVVIPSHGSWRSWVEGCWLGVSGYQGIEFRVRRTPHPVIVIIRDTSNYIRVFSYSDYTTVTE